VPWRLSFAATIPRVSSPSDAGGPVLERGDRVRLRRLRFEDEDAFLAVVAASRSLHHPWTSPPGDAEGFRALVERGAGGDSVSLAGWRSGDNTLVAVVNLSQIVRGLFQSCYCGFYANAATAGQGLTRETLQLALRYAFIVEGLHRVEANVQPGNAPSLALVRRVGFRHEGFSPRYLRIDGAWRDHERFAITIEDWLQMQSTPINTA
jgi:[ribosomal protein S5]-alanine N-acetyltransferase